MFYLVRHGETQWNVDGVYQGWSNNPLNEKGFAQAEDISREIAKLSPTAFYCSDLLRAKQTAEIINKNLGIKIIFDERLREFSLGAYEGKSKLNIPTQELYKQEFGAETPKEVFKRAKSFTSELKEMNISDALVVAHRGLIQMILYCIDKHKWNDEDSDTFFDAVFNKTPHTSIIKLDLNATYC